MNSLPFGVNAVIFDLGGVLVDLAPNETAKAFASLAGISMEDVLQRYTSHRAFNAYERGEISDAEFRNFIRHVFSASATDSEIDICWNAMLLGFPQQKLDKLQALKKYFHTIVLSNTNAIHIQFIETSMLQGRSLSTFFHKAYYSHLVKSRKPETDIYQHVLKSSNLTPEKTVFLDDNLENLEAANKLGIHTIHITHPDQVLDLFEKYE